MFRRIFFIVFSLVGLLLAGGALSGCDQLTDAAHSAKGTSSMQNRREHRNTAAINILDDMPKKKR